MSERIKRLEADARAHRVWHLGGIAYDPQREQRIRAAQDWPYLCVKASAFEREIYEGINGRGQALSDIVGYGPGGAFRVSQDTLLKLWRADSRSVES